MEMDDSHAIAIKRRKKRRCMGKCEKLNEMGQKIERNIDLLYRESISMVMERERKLTHTLSSGLI